MNSTTTTKTNNRNKMLVANLPISDSRLNGSLVGPGGSNLKKITNQLPGLRIQLTDSKNPENKRPTFRDCDTIRLCGPSKDVLQKGAALLKQELMRLKSQKTTQEKKRMIVEVKPEDVGKVFGKGGETIRSIKQRVGGGVNLQYEKSEGVFVVTAAKQETLNLAKIRIEEAIREGSRKYKPQQKEMKAAGNSFEILGKVDEISKASNAPPTIDFQYQSLGAEIQSKQKMKWNIRQKLAKSKGLLDREIPWSEVDAEVIRLQKEDAQKVAAAEKETLAKESEKMRKELGNSNAFPSFGNKVAKSATGAWGNGASKAVMSKRKYEPVVERKPKMETLTSVATEKEEVEEITIDGWVVDEGVNEFYRGAKSMSFDISEEDLEQEQKDYEEMCDLQEEFDTEEVALDWEDM